MLIRLAYFRPAHTLADDALDDYETNRLTVARQLHYSATDSGQVARPRPVRQRHPGRHRRAEEPADRADRRARQGAVPHATATRASCSSPRACARALRRRPGPGLHHDPAAGREDPVPAVQPRLGRARRRAARATRRCHGRVPRRRTCGSEVWQRGRLARPARSGSCTSSRSAKRPRRRVHQRAMIFPRFHQWHAVRTLDRPRARSTAPGTTTSSSTRPARASRTRSPGSRTGCPTCTARTTSQVFDKVIVITDRRSSTRSCRTRSTSSSTHDGVVAQDRRGPARSRAARRGALRGARPRSSSPRCRRSRSCWTRSSELRGSDVTRSSSTRRTPRSPASPRPRSRAVLGVDARRRATTVDEDGDPLDRVGAGSRRASSRTCPTSRSPPPRRRKTLELFGTPRPGDGRARGRSTVLDAPGDRGGLHPRRAAQLRHVQDVLAARERERRRARGRRSARRGSQLARFAVLSPAQPAQQRAEIIVEHFHEQGRRPARRPGQGDGGDQLAGARRAAVPASSSPTSEMRGYDDCGLLVAFSGALTVDGNQEDKVTEAGVNGFSETELPKTFAYTRADDPHADVNPKPEYRILVVAEKYQTGFDQPLLTTMYVDKTLHGRRGRADALAAQPHAPAQEPGGPARPRLRQRGRGHPQRVPAVLRNDHDRAHRPEPALRRRARGHGLRPARRVGDGGVRGGVPRRGIEVEPPRRSGSALHAELYRFTDPAATASPS